MVHVTGVVLAAGAGRRMGTVKADLWLDGARLLYRAVAVLHAAGCDDVAVVVRASTIAEPLADAAVANIQTLVNPEPERGMRSSLELAVNAAAPTAHPDAARPARQDGASGLAVLLVDTPGIGAEAVRAVIAHWRGWPERIAVGSFDGRHAHPIVMSRDRWRTALTTAGPDEGARAYLCAHTADVDAVPVPGDPIDLDRPTDVAAWLTRTPGLR